MAKSLRRPNSFTLIELLTVMAIIAILLGILLAALSGAMRTSSRSRARAEVQAMSAALESYKSDNGTYPTTNGIGFSSTNNYVQDSTGALYYQPMSAFLYEQLTGTTNYGDPPPTGTRTYMTFKSGQLGNDVSGGGAIYIRDPFGFSYGYYTGTSANPPNNGYNFFDLWSMGGDTTATNTAAWINNWSN